MERAGLAPGALAELAWRGRELVINIVSHKRLYLDIEEVAILKVQKGFKVKIPAEVRRAMGLKEGMRVEICTDLEGKFIIYEPVL